MKLTCKSCRKPIPAADVNIGLAIAKCSACNEVFSFAEELGIAPREAAAAKRPRIAQPKGFSVENWGTDLVITRRWWTPAMYFLLVFCIVWDGFLLFWYAAALAQKEIPWLMVLFPVLHVAVGVALTYTLICSMINRTWITVSMGELTIRHGPLPWPGNVTLNAGDIDQIYCQGAQRQTRHGSNFGYEIHALLRDGSKKKLLSGLDDGDHAAFIEQQIEEHLRIEDARVHGEMDH